MLEIGYIRKSLLTTLAVETNTKRYLVQKYYLEELQMLAIRL